MARRADVPRALCHLPGSFGSWQYEDALLYQSNPQRLYICCCGVLDMEVYTLPFLMLSLQGIAAEP
jgi:hypothetical protein